MIWEYLSGGRGTKSVFSTGQFRSTLLHFIFPALNSVRNVRWLRIHCNDPRWLEVILGLLQITARPADVELLVKEIRNNTPSKTDQQAREKLLAEVAFGSFNCPPRLAKELARVAIHEIESGTWLPHREYLLRHALDGLRSPSTSEMVKVKLPLWYQDRCGWGASGVFEAIGSWEPDEHVIETLFRGTKC